MDSKKPAFSSIDEYIATFPADIQDTLQTMRATIRAAAPDAQEKISYQMPAFALKGNLVYFAAWKNHIALYPGSGGLPPELKQRADAYESSKGSIHFPLGQPLPTDLITEIVRYRVADNLQRAEQKASQKKSARAPENKR